MGVLSEQNQAAQTAPMPPEAAQVDPMAVAQERAEFESAGEDGDEVAPESEQAFVDAMRVALVKLYEGDVSDGIAKALTGYSAADKVTGIVEQAQVLFNLADDVTEGTVPDEFYVMFGLQLMGEIVQIAQAAGITVSGREMADASKRFILQTVREMGGDTAELERAMGSVDQDELGAALEQVE